MVFREIQEGDYILLNQYAYLGERVGEIEVKDIKDRSIEKLIIPSKYKGKTVTTIASGVFSGCNSLTEVIFPNTLKYIEIYAFAYCEKLIEIRLPDSLIYINDKAFEGSTELSTITLGNSIKFICPNAFKDCNNLTDVYYNGTQEEWNKVNIMKDNECLLNAEVHFNN